MNVQKYKLISYPDGQINIQLLDNVESRINMRIKSYEDLFILKSIMEISRSLNHLQYKELLIPCLFGQRSDRRFQGDESFGLKIICDFINSMEFNRVKIFDPHSDVSLALINNSEKVSSLEYVKLTIDDIADNELMLVSPDAGAYKKVFKYAEDLNLPLIAANKFRDLKGNITLNILGDVKDKNCLIINDILDGGYTFHLLAKQLKEQGAKRIFLYISHAYFNKGIDFTEYIETFYCTNSVKDINDKRVVQFKIINE